MTDLPAGLLATFGAQTLGLTMKAVRGRRQMAVVAIFLHPLLQGLHLLPQPRQLLLQSFDHALLLLDDALLSLDLLVLHTNSFLQPLILLSQAHDFFFCRHGPTLLAFGVSCKSLVLLYCHKFS
jgi:hypothetical protein